MGVPHGAHPGGTPATEHTGSTMQIRNVTTADLAALEGFGRRALDDTYLRTGWLAADEVAEMLDWWTVDYFAEALGQPNIMLLAMANDELLGMTQTEIIEPTRAVTWKLYVDKALHGTGIGSALMEETEKALLDTVELWQTEYLSTNEPAARFYRSKGFEPDRDERYGDRTYRWVRRAVRVRHDPDAGARHPSDRSGQDSATRA
jgi:ribosomal protein S18 acetylase RimI-like enzyme